MLVGFSSSGSVSVHSSGPSSSTSVVGSGGATQGQWNPEEKIRIGVVPFNAPDQYRATAEGLTDRINADIANLGRFEVIERTRLSTVLAEQALGQTGALNEQSSAKVGNVLGVQHLVTGSVNIQSAAYNKDTKRWAANLSISFKFILSETGKIEAARSIEVNGRGDSEKEALFAAMVAASNAVIAEVRLLFPLECRIVKIDNGVVYITLGTNMGIRRGMSFTAWRMGEHVFDTVTGLDLGMENTETGVIVVTEAFEKFSKAKIQTGEKTIARGDLLKEIKGGARGATFVGYAWMPMGGTLNTSPDTIIVDSWWPIDTVPTSFPEYSVPSMMHRIQIGFEGTDMFVKNLGMQAIFGFGFTGKDVGAFSSDINLTYNVQIVPDRFYLPLSAGFAWGSTSVSYKSDFADALARNKGYTSDDHRAGSWNVGGVATAGLRVMFTKRFGVVLNGGYRLMTPIHSFEITYDKGTKDKNGKEETENMDIDARFSPLKTLTQSGPTAGINFIFAQ